MQGEDENLFRAMASRLGGAVDQALVGALGWRFSRRRPPVRATHAPEAHDRRALLAEATAFYQGAAARFFAAPPASGRPPGLVEAVRGSLPGGGAIVDVKWESGFQPVWERVRLDYLGHQANRWAFRSHPCRSWRA